MVFAKAFLLTLLVDVNAVAPIAIEQPIVAKDRNTLFFFIKPTPSCEYIHNTREGVTNVSH